MGLAGEEPESSVVTKLRGEEVAAVALAPLLLHQQEVAAVGEEVAAVVLAPLSLPQPHCLPQNSNV